MEEQKTRPGEIWNNHWNNHICFCSIIKPYMTLHFAIKNGDIGLLKYVIREICIIFQSPVAKKLKYIKAILR